jgi:CRP-like cAMP-binding protein
VSRGRTESVHPNDSVIYRQGAPADAVFLQKGKIKLTVASKQGKEVVIGLFGPDEFFGEGCLISQTLLLATATAMVDSEVLRVDYRDSVLIPIASRAAHTDRSGGERTVQR